MKLRQHLWAMVAAATVAVCVPVSALWLLSSDIRRVHAGFREAQTELGEKLALISATEGYFRSQMDRIDEGASAEGEPAERAKVLVLYKRIDDLIRANDPGEDGAAELAHQGELRAKFVALADGLAPLTQKDSEAVEALDRRFDTELLPALFASAGHESAVLADNTETLYARAERADWIAAFSLVAGVLSLGMLVRLLISRTQAALGQMLTATRGLGSGNLELRVADLPVDEFNEIGHAFNGMATALKDATDARVRTEKLAAVGQLAASVGHEIRNPLSAARNALTYLRRKQAKAAPPEKGDRSLEFIELADRELEACNRIVQDLLDFARERPLTLASSTLSPLIAEVLQVVRGRPDVALNNGVTDDLPPFESDRDQLRQVLINLVQNGVEAIPEDRKGSVTINARVDGERLRISVADDGTGIPEADRKRIFEPLVTTKTKGTGLGLAITSAIVKRHGGTLELESALGVGTSFHISLPLTRESTAS